MDYDTETSFEASSDSELDSESETQTRHELPWQPEVQSQLSGPETTSQLPQTPTMRTMPGSFDEAEEEENSGATGQDKDVSVDEDGERGRPRRVVVPLGLEILNMTVVTERGRRWKVRELEGSRTARGRGRFGRERIGGGWRWSW